MAAAGGQEYVTYGTFNLAQLLVVRSAQTLLNRFAQPEIRAASGPRNTKPAPCVMWGFFIAIQQQLTDIHTAADIRLVECSCTNKSKLLDITRIEELSI